MDELKKARENCRAMLKISSVITDPPTGNLFSRMTKSEDIIDPPHRDRCESFK
jgi:hypothetical protein